MFEFCIIVFASKSNPLVEKTTDVHGIYITRGLYSEA